MTFSLRIPSIQVQTRFFARFTPFDLVRLGVPVLVVGGLFYAPAQHPVRTLGGIGAGLLIGLLWYIVTWEDRNVDQHLLAALHWLMHHYFDEDSSTDLACQHDHFETSDGVVGIIAVTPTELDLKTRDKQEALHGLYQQLFDTISYPVEVHSRQAPLDLGAYMRTLEERVDTPGDLVTAYRQYCQELDTGNALQTRHYLVLRVDHDTATGLSQLVSNVLPDTATTDQPAADTDHLVSELDERCQQLQNLLNASDLEARRVTGDRLEQLADHVHCSSAEQTIRYPLCGDRWTRTVALTEYPQELRFGWPLPLFRLPGRIHVTQTVTPQEQGTVMSKLERKLEQASAEIDSFLAGGHLGTNKLEQQHRDIQWLLDLFTKRSDTPVTHGVYITVDAHSKDACDDHFQQLTDQLDAMRIGYREPVFQTEQARQTTDFVGGDPLHEVQLLPSRSAAAGLPFGTAQTSYHSGVVYGRDAIDGTPVLLDRFQWSSHSMAVMGMTGSGKSYLAKLEILRSYVAYPDLQIAVFDPKKEYSDIVEALGGVVTVQGPETTHAVNDFSADSFRPKIASYEVPDRGQAENVTILVDLLREVYKEVSQTERQTLVFIDEARILLNDPEGRNLLNQFVLEARDTDTAVTMLTQNASQFTHSRQGREILDNVPGKILMQHDRVADSVKQYFQLSNQEAQALYTLKTGTDCRYSEGLLKVSNQLDTKLRIESTPLEHEVID